MKHCLLDKFNTFFTLTRAYSLPISVMSWLVPFIFACFENGNILNGIIALIGIIFLHLASNLFDDIVDYFIELQNIQKGKKTNFNFQQGKCCCILDKKITLKSAVLINVFLFTIAFLIGLYFFFHTGYELFYIVVPTALLCLLYPILGCRGFGEIIIGLIFSPFLYSGVYLVMTGAFSLKVLILAISTGFLTVAVLVNHSLLDYKFDTTNRKITLCRITGSEKKSLILLIVIISMAYLNILFWIVKGNISFVYFLPFLTLSYFLKLIKEMKIYINQNMPPDNSQDFLKKFMLAQNLQKNFIILLCLSIIISNWYKI